MKTPLEPSRRALLRAGGAAALLASFLRQERAVAQAATPKRLILFHTPNGIEHLRLLPPSLEKHRSDLLLVDGPDWTCVDKSMLPSDDHGNGVRASFSAWPLPDKKQGGPTLDQFVANALRPPTKFATLQLGVLAFGYGGDHLNARADGTPIPADYRPRPTFDKLFAGLTPAPSGAAPAGPSPVELAHARRKSVLDHLMAELATVSAQLGGAERRKLEAHLEALRALEKRLAAPPPTLGAAGASCSAASIASVQARIAAAKIPDYSPDYSVHFPAASGIMQDMLAIALACGLTRIATLRYAGAVSNIRHTWIGSARGHHDLAHGGSAAADEFRRVTHWYADEFSAFLGKLKAIPEGNGSMLDNSLVFWSSDMANGGHGFRNAFYVVAGRAGGALRTGRTLRVPGTNHSDLLLSVAHAMGVTSAAKFGNPVHCNGPLAGFL